MSGHDAAGPVLRFPPDFDDYGWEVESKGYFGGAVVEYEGRRMAVTFYDPVRLAQDIDEEIEATGRCSFSSLVVIPAVTRPEMEQAVARLAESGELGRMGREI